MHPQTRECRKWPIPLLEAQPPRTTGQIRNARMMVWIWDASGPAADACGVAGTAEAARSAAGSLVADGRAEAARVEQAAIVVGSALTYDYCPTGQAWHARLDAGRLTWTLAIRLLGQAAP